MRKLSEIRPELTENDILLQLYVDNDRLYVIKQGWETQQEEIQSDSTEADNDSGFIGCYKYEPDGNVSTVLLTYDISERANPVLSATMKWMEHTRVPVRLEILFICLLTVGCPETERTGRLRSFRKLPGKSRCRMFLCAEEWDNRSHYGICKS